MPAVSVIIPTYRHRDYILLTLESVFAQTFTDLEVIVVNDGSPDDTSILLAPIAAAGKIRYIEQSNAGQAAARNRGFTNARGDFIAFLDDDDIWPPDKLLWQVEMLRADAALGVVGGIGAVLHETGSLEVVREPVGEITLDIICRGCPMLSPGQALIRRTALENVGGFDVSIRGADDWDLWLRLVQTTQIVIVPRVSLMYRSHGASASRDHVKMFQNTIAVINRNFPGGGERKSRKLRRDAFRYQYQYIGRRISEDFRTSMRQAKIRSALLNLSHLRAFVEPAIRDFRLLFWLIRGLMPIALARHLSRRSLRQK